MLQRRKAQQNKGFSTAEMLITVAILIVLTSVVFIGVIQYMRRMAQLERDGFAKEIFVAAQNHLTMAKEQGYLGLKEEAEKPSPFGEKETQSSANVRYFIVTKGAAFGKNTVLDLMLPFASVDETVRLGGSYLVRYQPEPALVLDVFYCSPAGTRYGHDLVDSEYSAYLDARDTEDTNNKMKRRTFGGDKAVLGWYGGEEALKLEKGERLEAPLLEVRNAETLTVRVTDTNSLNIAASLRLIITGKTSGKQTSIVLSLAAAGEVTGPGNLSYDSAGGTYTVTLDDITKPGMHFAELFGSQGLIPGEDLLIQAVAYSNSVLTNVAYSAEKTTNSLYADPDGKGIRVGNIRHLENLDPTISGVKYEKLPSAEAAGGNEPVSGTPDPVSVRQTTDLDWAEFRKAIDEEAPDNVSIYRNGEPAADALPGTFISVCPGASIAYDGQKHTVSGIVIDNRESLTAADPGVSDAGLFGSLAGGSVKDLMLADFDVASANGNAGSLIGSASEVTVTNVVSVDRKPGTAGESSTSEKVRVTAKEDAGGLIGKMSGGSVTASAAALIVKSESQNAGGLIGSCENAAVSDSYSGGHTKDGLYDHAEGAVYNITASSGNAGGLIGDCSGSAVTNSYSTCSVSGVVSGGFAGTVTGKSSIKNCYSTGLVRTDAQNGSEGAFAGSAEAGGTEAPTFSGCAYFEIVNERVDTEAKTISYLAAVPVSEGQQIQGISAFDKNLTDYRNFANNGLPENGERNPALPYDPVLIRNYQGKYSLKTVGQLDSNSGDDWYVLTHYGDWPSPEILFMNTPES